MRKSLKLFAAFKACASHRSSDFMKIKKFSLLIVAFVAAVATAFSVAYQAPAATVSADESAPKLAYAYNSYDVSYVKDKVSGSEDYHDGKYLFEYAAASATSDEDYKEVSATTVTFDVLGDLKLRIYEKEGTDRTYVMDGEEKKVFNFTTVKAETDVIKYLDVERDTYQQQITDKLSTRNMGDSFEYPTLESYIVSDLFAYTNLSRDLYYAGPEDTSFKKASGSTFKLSAVGTYNYYVVPGSKANGAAYNLSEKVDGEDKYERKNGAKGDGWYVKGTDDLVVPVFSFEFKKSTPPRITVSTSDKGFIGLKYEVDSITVDGDSTKKYTLWYSENDLSDDSAEWTSNGVTVVKTSAIELTEDTDSRKVGFNSSSVAFTPDKAGYYYVICEAGDTYGIERAVTNPIYVSSEKFREVKFEFDFKAFMKNNYVSIIFLGIAILSAIGIVILLFVKPKDAKEEDVTPVAKK